jgi:dTDP-4-amino-4,6-dideoxygalactose transaminase
MEKLPEIITLRRELIKSYQELLQPAVGYLLPSYLEQEVPDSISIQTLMITLDQDVDRDRVMMTMLEAGIEVRPGSVSSHLLAAFADYSDGDDDCPIATRLHQNGLALPLHPGLSLSDIEHVVSHLKTAISVSRC